MAFPVVAGTAISAQSTASNPNGISLPAGVVAGDLLLVLHESPNGSVTLEPGWVEFFSQSGAAGNFQHMYYKKAVGGETGLNVTLPGANGFAANAYRISGAINPAILPPQAVGIGGKVFAPPIDGRNPPPLTPAGGSLEYLWITGFAASDSGATGPPSPYTDQILIASAGGGRMNSARRFLLAATEDPGAWINGTGSYSTTTIAITPGLPGGVATLAGTVTDDTEIDIRAGGSTIILTLLGATWAAAGATFEAQRQNIIDGLVSAQSEANAWNAVLRPAIPVTGVVRTSDTVVTITLPVEAGYSIVFDETITATIPASATDDLVAIVAEPTFSIIHQPPPFYPQIEAFSSSFAAGSPVVAGLPTPVSDGELLLAFVSHSTGGAAVFPSPWVVLGSAGATSPSGQRAQLTVAYLKASGGETSVSISGVSQTCWIIYRITGHRDPDIQAPSIAFQASVRTDITPLDPPLVAPPEGEKEYLWLAGGAALDLGCNQIGNPPANYGSKAPFSAEFDCQTHPGARIVFACRRELTAASENPGAFAILGAGSGAGCTVALAGVQAEGQPVATAAQVAMQQRELLLF